MPGRLWTHDSVIAAIRNESMAGHPLNYSSVEKRVPALLRSAQRMFGSWAAAVEASGIDYTEIRLYKTWSREKIIERVREWHEKGADLSWRHVCLTLDPPLAAAVFHCGRFSSWSDALLEAGLEPEKVSRYRKWSKSKVQQELFGLVEQGANLDQDSLADTAPALLAAIYRHGSGLVSEREMVYGMMPNTHDEQLAILSFG